MLQLMKLEIKKFKLGWYVQGAIIANILMTAILCFIMYIAPREGDIIVTKYEDIFILTGAIVRATFIVFASVLIAKLVIEEYKNKTILILFSYPVNRKKLMASKLLLIGLLTLFTVLLSNIFVAGSIWIINGFFPIVPFQVTTSQFLGEVLKMIPFAIATAGTSLIPLFFGMRKHSVPITITSSLFVIAIVGSYNPAFSTVTFVPLQLTFAAIGVLIAYFTIRQIEKIDAI